MDDNQIMAQQNDTEIGMSIDMFNNNIEYIQNEHKDVIKNLKQFLKQMLNKMLKNDDIKKFDHKLLQSINALYVTLNKSIMEYNDNNMVLITKLMELNEKLNPNTIDDVSHKELDDANKFMEEWNRDKQERENNKKNKT